jgi:hypothetical protein
MKDESKIIILSIFLTLIVLTIGLSYAYFSAKLIGNETSSTITLIGGNMDIIYDGGPNITINNVYPQPDPIVQKDFTVIANNSTYQNLNYELKLIIDLNTFSDNALSFSLTSNNIAQNGITASTDNKVNINSNYSIYSLGIGSFIGKVNNAIHSYSLLIYFLNTDQDQNIDQNALFNAHIGIESVKNIYLADESMPDVTSGNMGPFITAYNPNDINESIITIYSVGYSTDNSSYNLTINLNGLPYDIENIKILSLLETDSTAFDDDINTFLNYKNGGNNLIVLSEYNGKTINYNLDDIKTYKTDSNSISSSDIRKVNNVWKLNISGDVTNTTEGQTVTTIDGETLSNVHYVPFIIKLMVFQPPEYWKNAPDGSLLSHMKQNSPIVPNKYDFGITSTIEEESNPYGAPVYYDNSFWFAYDDYGKSLYFRGFVKNNLVNFANKCWRIVRTTGDGNIKLLLQNNNDENDPSPCNPTNQSISNLRKDAGKVKFNENVSSPIYAGLLYGNPNSNVFIEKYANITKSSILSSLEAYYINNLIEYSNYFADVIWCNDKTEKEKNINSCSFFCTDKTSNGYLSRYTVNDTVNGNGDLTYPIGLITFDEYLYAEAGHLFFYDPYWTMTPDYSYIYNDAKMTVEISNPDFPTRTFCSTNESISLRPSIALKSSVTATGSGTKENPYVITGY